MRLTNLLLLAGILLGAETPTLPEPYQSIAGLAHAAPPEFGADALLRIAESGKIADRDARRDLVEQAFRLASGAHFRVRLRGLRGSMVDTRPGFLNMAYDLKLDALSLQSRAVRAMLSMDKPKARELFLEIARPSLPPLTCEDVMVYDVSGFYQTLASVVASTFTDKERKKEEHVSLLLDYIAQAASPAQLAPLAQAIKSVSLTAEQRAVAFNRFNGLLENMQPDARLFTATLNDLSREIAPEMQTSFDKYLQKGKSAAACNDGPAFTVDIANGDKPPATSGDSPKIERYWQSPEAKRLLEGGKKLRFGPDGKLFADADRATPEWQLQLTDYLSELAGWSPGQEKSEADYYHQKCIVYQALVELIPPGPQRDKVLAEFVSFIANSNLQQQSPVEWFMHAHAMLERVRGTNGGEPAKVLDAFRASGNPVLALYAALESTFASQRPSWATPSTSAEPAP